FIAHSKDPSLAKSIQNQEFTNTSNYHLFSSRKPNRGFFSGVSILSGLAVAISLSGTFDTALAAPDGPKPVIARVSQDEPLEVPGSFKDLPAATDSVTAKRQPEH